MDRGERERGVSGREPGRLEHRDRTGHQPVGGRREHIAAEEVGADARERRDPGAEVTRQGGEPNVPRADFGWRHVDLVDHRVGHQLEQRALVRNVVVEGHRRHPELGGECPHGEVVEADLLGDAHGTGDDFLPPERRPLRCPGACHQPPSSRDRVLLSILPRWRRRSGRVRTSRIRRAPTAGSRCAPPATGPGSAGSGCRPRCSAPTRSRGSTSCARRSTKADPAWPTEGGPPRCSTRSSATCRSSTARSR